MPTDHIAPATSAPTDRLSLGQASARGAAEPSQTMPGFPFCPCFADDEA